MIYFTLCHLETVSRKSFESFLQKNHPPVFTEYFYPSGFCLMETHFKVAYVKKGFFPFWLPVQPKGAGTVLASGESGSRPPGPQEDSVHLSPATSHLHCLPCWPRSRAGSPTVSFRLTPSHPGPRAAKAASFLMVPSSKSQNKLSVGHLESCGHS